jgi:hypothetical protein
LPATAVKYVVRLEELIGAPVALLLSTRPDREDTVLVRDPFAELIRRLVGHEQEGARRPNTAKIGILAPDQPVCRKNNTADQRVKSEIRYSGGTMEFSRRSTNFDQPNNGITIEKNGCTISSIF